MFVKPIEGGHDVLDPHTKQPIPREGIEVDGSAYWVRRVRDGDLVEVKPEAAPPEPESKS